MTKMRDQAAACSASCNPKQLGRWEVAASSASLNLLLVSGWVHGWGDWGLGFMGLTPNFGKGQDPHH
jgi:hypothetical protein